ncbi:MAG: hypothetical protein QNJ33_20745, partial [Crocosphaera sp.]|nr:hypothetical protein [Crocosphaera sp.]
KSNKLTSEDVDLSRRSLTARIHVFQSMETSSPQVIRDLIDIATYLAENNLENSDRFLFAAEETLKQLGQMICGMWAISTFLLT